jgi:integrase
VPSFNFTIDAITKAMASAPIDKPTVLRDAKTTGLIIRGKRGSNWSWSLEKRINEKLCRGLLGRWEETRDIEAMRTAAAEMAASFRRGEDPRKPDMDAQVAAALKVTAEDWRKRWASTVRERTASDAANDLKYLGLTNKPLLQLTKADIAAAYESRIQQVSMVTAAKEMRTVRLLWNVAYKTLPDDCGVELRNPVAAALSGGKGAKNKLLPKVVKKTFVPAKLMPEFIQSLRMQQEVAGVGLSVRSLAAEFLVLTGLRAKEVTNLRWGEVSIKAGEFTIPAERSKNGHPLTRSLTPRLMEIIQIRLSERGKKDVYVFQSATKAGVPVYDVSDPIAQAGQTVGYEHRTPHDMRRSYISAAVALGINPVISRLLTNHLNGDIHDGYTQPTQEEIKAAELTIESALIGCAV